jgi:type I restriction enzyme R subunit
MIFNEDSRVKIPAILHLCRLGYEYLPLSGAEWNPDYNIFPSIFYESMRSLNPGIEDSDIKILYDKMTLALENEDVGKAFYEIITADTGPMVIDFKDFRKNILQVVTELPCINGEDEFRPDITLLVNGLPLVFIEVKKPNNLDGIQAEYKRIQARFKNKKFRKFINITQLMMFSNNMPYDDEGTQPLQGAFYATPGYGKVSFNYFREEESIDRDQTLKVIPDEMENHILRDNNLIGIKQSPEFITNKHPETPTNKISTSLFRPERLAFILKYGIAYVKSKDGMEKHIMRYPQIFATKAIERTLDKGIRNGIIWHTQGSGKTALGILQCQVSHRLF